MPRSSNKQGLSMSVASTSVGNTIRRGLNTLIILGAWILWKHHNDCIFNGVSKSCDMFGACRGGGSPLEFGWGPRV
uniref:Uncharacterized protein n=1 Tax=Arundo donax TaxID=35708 RepID=A0A0A9FLA7_ARUDO